MNEVVVLTKQDIVTITRILSQLPIEYLEIVRSIQKLLSSKITNVR